MTDSPATVSDLLRPQMPVCGEWIYFDHAAVAPLSLPASQAIAAWLQQATTSGDVHWLQWAQRTEQFRRLVAHTIHAQESEIALIPNTTTGIGLVAEGFPWHTGDNVVTAANEFPSNQYPWLNLQSRGVEVRKIQTSDGRITIDDIQALCDSRTRVVALSWVGFASGWRIDVPAVGQFCQERGIFFLLDAIQGLGVFPLDATSAGVDALAADGHKWLLGPEGAGVLYVRQKWLEHLRPLMVGWNSVARREFSTVAWEPRPSAARYEGGSLNMAGFLGLAASWELFVSLGLNAQASPLAERILQLTDYAAQRLLAAGAQLLSPRTAGHNSGIVTFTWPGEAADALRQRLLSAKIVTSSRGGGVRLSLHAYNTTAEIDQFLSVLTAAK